MDLKDMTFSQLLDAHASPNGGWAINDKGAMKRAINAEIDRRWKLLVDIVENLSGMVGR